MATIEQLWQVIEPYLAAEGLELDDLELLGHGRARTLRVVVDGMAGIQGSIDLDRISEVSRGLSRLLDTASDLAGPYQLEVSSPGLERKLTRRRHYEKSRGREIVVKTGSSTVRGVLEDVSDESFRIAGDAAEPATIAYGDVVSARTVFRWERSPKPGQARRQP